MASLLFLLLVAFLHVESCLSDIYSFKLIHRFSKEAMAPQVGQNGESFNSWPTHNSVDGYKLLAKYDSQRLKQLGARFPLLFPSEGSKTCTSPETAGWLHYTWINIGTPNVSFFVALDTGSDLFWVPCDCIQCAPLSAIYYTERNLSMYNPLASSTSRHLACSDELCILGWQCKNKNGCRVPSPGERLHYTWINIGTPNVSFFVALDTGSDLFWVPCDCIQCAPLSAIYYTERNLSMYNPLASSTSRHLACSDELCILGWQCKNKNDACPYNVNYVSPNTSSSGFIFIDRLNLSSSSNDASRTYIESPIILGCGRKQTGALLNEVSDGLMGLGLGSISVPSYLAKAGLVSDSFSLCFLKDYSGTIFFGDQGLKTQHSTPFLPVDDKYVTYIVGVESCCIATTCIEKSGFRAIVDSATTFTHLPKEVFEKITAEFDRQMNTTRYRDPPWEYCYLTSLMEINNIPSMTLTFAMGNKFVAQKPVQVFIKNQEVSGFCLGILPAKEKTGIIGQSFMTDYRMVFDREHLRLGWSLSDCEDLTKERPPQHIPDGWTVAPPAPSAASLPLIAAWLLIMRLLPLLLLLLLS